MDLTEYGRIIFVVCISLLIYTGLILIKVFAMKIKEDFLRENGTKSELQDFLKNKNLKHVLTLGLL